ncbi:MAG: carotenoid oxygenase family protein [Candidatus Margulisiibacteriota bacterium]|nr:carotenoid oxygenase family protein [Candidatus Margulisiibacteriota bacterium]
MSNHQKLFKNSSEQNPIICHTTGSIPSWLTGNLYRIGPGKFNFKQQSVNHWFDGMGLLHHFNIEKGSIHYQSKFIESSAYKNAEKSQKLCFREFATDPCATFFKRFFTRFNQNFTSNTMVNIAKLGNEMVSLTETPQPIVFDKSSLETIKPYSFSDEFHYNLHTAHPHKNSDDKSMINLGIRMGRKTCYEFFKVQNNKRQLISSLKVNKPSYQHSFGMTKNYLIIIDTPFKVSPLSIRFGTKPYIKNFKWHENKPTKFHIFNLKTGEKKCTIETPGFFMFHQVNAYEQNHNIIFDTVAFKDAAVINALYLKNLHKNNPSIPSGKLTRFTLDITERKMISQTILRNDSIELPSINYDKCNGKPYTFTYALNISNNKFFDQIIKINVKTLKTEIYKKENCIPSEPIFVQNPSKKEEDDGIILSVLFNTNTNCTELHGIDAKTMNTLFVSTIKGIKGYTFHGQFLKSEN